MAKCRNYYYSRLKLTQIHESRRNRVISTAKMLVAGAGFEPATFGL